ncbi:MAG: VOC family protein [Chloroflexota bacterium]|nr:VOC family protein [Chloroflexota bacterium]
MQQRVTILTVRVEDLEAATGYYVDRLGWKPFLAVPGEVTFLQVARGLALSLFDAKGFDADAGQQLRFPFTLAHNVDSEDEVRGVVATMKGAGGTVIKEPQSAVWGGYHAFVTDPVGCCWEIAHNPAWSIANDGTVRLGGSER